MEAKTTVTALSMEILQMIIEECIPEGFEALSLTCRALYAASKRYIPDYERLKERFFEIDYTDAEPPEPEDEKWFWEALPGNPLAHLLQLAREPVATRFVEFAILEYRHPDPEWFELKSRRRVAREVKDAVRERGVLFHLLQRSLCRNDLYSLYEAVTSNHPERFLDEGLATRIKDFKPRDCSLHEMEGVVDLINSDSDTSEDEFGFSLDSMILDLVENTDYATTCLLSLLPNISYLHLRWSYGVYLNRNEMYHKQLERMWAFLSAIASNANNPKKHLAGLSKLTTLSLTGGCIHLRAPIETYLPLLTIDSLKTVHLHALVLSADKMWPTCAPISMFGQNIETLVLSGNIIREGDTWEGCLAGLLSRMPKLKSLRLYPQQLDNNCKASFTVPKVMDEICKHLGESLERFSLTGSILPGKPSGLVPGKTTMKQFKQLSTVELDIRGFQPGGPWRFPSLVELLPSSITCVVLLIRGFKSKEPEEICDKAMAVLEGLLHDFGPQHKTKLPNIRDISLRGRLTEEFIMRFDESCQFDGVWLHFEEDNPDMDAGDMCQ